MFIFSDSGLCADAFKAAKSPLKTYFLRELHKAKAELQTPIPPLLFSDFKRFEESGDRSVYEKQYFARRKALTVHLLSAFISHSKEDIHALEDILWAICDEFTWALPAHLSGVPTEKAYEYIDLFAAETAQTIAEALSLVPVHPAVKARCGREVFARVLNPFAAHPCGWEDLPNNWAAVCGGAVGMAALYLLPEGEPLNAILKRCKHSCNRFIDGCSSDGVCKEGLLYWAYAMQYYVAFDELMLTRKHESIVQNEEKVRRLARFAFPCCLGGGVTVKFSDSLSVRLPFGLSCKLAEKYGAPMATEEYYTALYDDCFRACGALRNIAWFCDSAPSAASGEAFYAEGQWAFLASGDTRVAVKGGHNDEPHNHNDVGSFISVIDGEIVLDDLGCPAYNKDYFSDKRYTYVNASALGHSVPYFEAHTQCAGYAYAADRFVKSGESVQVSFLKPTLPKHT